ncbi:NTPase KAP family P-loop domain-containing protein 1, partial [Arapaima gigas]
LGTELSSDSIYANALSKTLIRVVPPATVGLYSSCHSRIKEVLKNIEGKEQRYKEHYPPRSQKSSIVNILALLFRLLFFEPVYTKQNQKQKNVRYIFVRFSAWHFSGSDFLWAGLVMRLYMGFQEHFGNFHLSLYRVTQYTETTVRPVIVDQNKDWRPKKFCCIPLWLLTALTSLGTLIIVVLLIKFGFQKEIDDSDLKEKENYVNVVEGFAIATLGVPAITVVRFFFMIGKNLIFNQGRNIRSMIDNEKVSNKLGFMNEIRKEMEILSSFIHFMEIFERRKIRVVLEITHLDRCSPKKIAGVLNAINILLSDEDSPFISLLAVNPEVLTQQVDYVDDCNTKEDRAYAFLNRIVTLAFTIPELCDAAKCKVFQKISQGQLETLMDFTHDENTLDSTTDTKTSICLEDTTVERGPNKECCIPLCSTAASKMAVTLMVNEDEVEDLIESTFEYIYKKGKLHTYVMGDTISMRRIINSVRMSVTLMCTLKTEIPLPEHIAAWVVLANQWPCRLSWILQCVEDDRQREYIDCKSSSSVSIEDSKTLWEVFNESKMELCMIQEKINSLLEQDGDPELFERFLNSDFKFTIKDASSFKLSTVNLDHSIQRELARVRGTSSLKETIYWKTLIPLQIKYVLNMSTEDVCKEMEKLGLPETYAKAVRDNALKWQALVYSDHDESRKVLQTMSLGECTVFALHFLGLTPPVPPSLSTSQNKPPSAVINPSPSPSVTNL